MKQIKILTFLIAFTLIGLNQLSAQDNTKEVETEQKLPCCQDDLGDDGHVNNDEGVPAHEATNCVFVEGYWLVWPFIYRDSHWIHYY